MLGAMGQHDPLMKDALTSIIERRDFIKSLSNDQSFGKSNKSVPPTKPKVQIENDFTIVSDLIKKNQASIEELKQTIQTKSGPELVDFISEDIGILKKILFDPQSTAVFMAAMDASSWINEKMETWLGEKTQQTRFLNPYQTILLQKWVWRYWMSQM